ncbi:hypothetical protein DSCW_32610 [Desulfosarcina widdelii]|uniref:Secretin/TonB short N-terminal domain-containing protein n=1 Tax=Desulfosarcina widdelii TaxID=947919 RepID=A0A5K7ZBN1_9BACT|nr:hypothetical protein [Desulfosarcina widdelii]BBO75844.1 hypothetical protein DSCW_32610 [Desulfosarcina widdelii]
MKTIFYLAIGIWIVAALGLSGGQSFALQETTQDPLISITAVNQPLGEVLDQITGETGYQFNLDSKWEDHRVSATLNQIPLERGLKRLLRSLNYSIIWESDNTVTIVVYGKSEPGRDQGAVSFAPPPQEVPAEPEPALEVEPEDEQPSDRSETEALEPPSVGGPPSIEESEEAEPADAGGQDSDEPVERGRMVE